MQQTIKPTVRFAQKPVDIPPNKQQQVHLLYPSHQADNAIRQDQSQYTVRKENMQLPKLNSQISFGKEVRNSPSKEPIRLTFNSQETGQTSYLPPPQYNSIQNHYFIPMSYHRLEPMQKHLRMKQNKDSTVLKSGQVKTFTVDTNEFKTVKQGQFIGCFNCFEPVTYSTTGKTC